MGLLQLLTEHGANVNTSYNGLEECRSSRWRGWVLQLALDLGDEGIISFLRKRGAQGGSWIASSGVVRFGRAEDTWTREGKLKTSMRLRRHIGVNMCTGSMPDSGYLPG
jgi:hypothetical protein